MVVVWLPRVTSRATSSGGKEKILSARFEKYIWNVSVWIMWPNSQKVKVDAKWNDEMNITLCSNCQRQLMLALSPGSGRLPDAVAPTQQHGHHWPTRPATSEPISDARDFWNSHRISTVYISNIPAKSSSSDQPNDLKNHAIGYTVSYLKSLVFISISIIDSDAAAADGRDGSFCSQQTEEDRSSDAMRWREKWQKTPNKPES